MKIRIHQSELVRGQTVPLPWWADEPRKALGLVILGTPAIEMDSNDQPTGWFNISSPLIDKWDVWILDIMRAGWAYLDTLTAEEAEGVMAYQSLTEWDHWQNLVTELTAGDITPAEAKQRAIDYAIVRAAALGIDPPPEDEDDI